MRIHRLCAVAALSLVAVTVGAHQSLALQVDTPKITNPDPVNTTPHVLDGKVSAIVQIGSTVVVGGLFTKVRTATSAAQIVRVNIFAFDAKTGAVSTTFVPNVDGEVTSLAASADGTSVFVGGLFNRLNGVASKAVGKLTLADGTTDPTFTGRASARVMHLVVRGDRLYIGGFFTSVNGIARTALAALDVTSGALLPSVDLRFEGPRRTNGTPHILKFDITPEGDRLVAIGNFTYVAGARRDQLVAIDLGSTATVAPAWSTTRYQQHCSSTMETYMRDIDLAPDGSFFVVVTSGGGYSGSLCDTAARWETASAGTSLQPTWIDYTGGDTLFSVAVTTGAVYVGGHQRWANNTFGRDSAGPGAVARSGLAALDPVNGLPFQWNPGRTRGVGAFELTVTNDGLWVGSDTDRLGLGGTEYHGRVALLPLAGGTTTTPNVASEVPADLYMAGPTSRSLGTTSLRRSRLSGDGALPTIRDAAGGSIDWSDVRAAFMVNGRLYLAQRDGRIYERDFDGTNLGTARVVNLNGLSSTQLPVSSLTGMYYAAGRVFYTRTNDSRLYWRWFLPESEVFGADTFTTSGTWPGLGMDVAGGRVHYATTKGELWSAALAADGSPIPGTAVRVDDGSTTDWRSRDLFVFNGIAGARRPNAAPVPAVAESCDDLTCSYDGRSSTDADGTVTDWTWRFSDGTTARGAQITKTWPASGAVSVDLTVTDDSAATATKRLTGTVTSPNDTPPVATFTATCADRTCQLDSSGSSSPNGAIASAAWDFGDGTVASGTTTTHVFPADGTYDVHLVVTDAAGASAGTLRTVKVALVTFRAASSAKPTSTTPSIVVPAGTRSGDALVLFATVDSASSTITAPNGWSEVTRATGPGMRTIVFSKVASATDPGSTVTVKSSAVVRSVLQMLAYAGASKTSPVLGSAAAVETTSTAAHTSPTLATSVPSWVLSHTADLGTTTVFTKASTQRARSAVYGTDPTHLAAFATEHTTTRPAGTVGGVVATANAPSADATMITVALRPV